MALRPAASGVLFKSLLTAGVLLAVALLAQTVTNYLYVSENLIQQEARRAAEERVRGFERSARIAHAGDPAAYQIVLDDFRDDAADQVASILLMNADGTVVASSGATMPVAPVEARRRFLGQRDAAMSRDDLGGREVFVGIFACRCNLARPSAATEAPPPARLLVQLAIDRDSLAAPFARLRRNASISAAAALSLLVALTLIGVRVGPYVRGKQLEGQMTLAREVQRALLPGANAWPAGVDAAGVCAPASQVGGDFYDVRALANGRIAFSLGDVSGHGMSAALLMGMMHGALSASSTVAIEESPDRTAARLNELLLTKATRERFASVIWCVYDPASGSLHYVNAGHLPGLLLRRESGGAERVARLADGGPVLGVVPAAIYHTAIIESQAGDVLVLFSDGIVETTNGGEDYYGEGRLLAVVEQHRELPAAAICDAILSSVNAFAGGRPAEDDRTILVVRLWRNVE